MDEKIWRVVLKTGAVVELRQPFPHAKGAVSRVDANVARLLWQEAEGGRPAGIMVFGDLVEKVVQRDHNGNPIVQVDENTKKALVTKDPSSPGFAHICGPGYRPIFVTKTSEQFAHKKLAMMFLPAGENGVVDYWESMADLPHGLGSEATLEQIQAKLTEDIEAQIAAATEDDETDDETDEPDTLGVDALVLFGSLIEGGKIEADQSGIDKTLALIDLIAKSVEAKREKDMAEFEKEADAAEAAALAEEEKEEREAEAAEKAAGTPGKSEEAAA